MNEESITNNAFRSFETYLDYLVSNPVYQGFLNSLMEMPESQYYVNDCFHSVLTLLNDYPEAKKILHEFGFRKKDKSISFSPENLKAAYLIDEDFINEGRAFIVFNIVGSSWNYIAIANNQAKFWTIVV